MEEKELDQFSEIVTGFLADVILFADANNYDRDNLVRYAAKMLSAMAEISTFKN